MHTDLSVCLFVGQFVCLSALSVCLCVYMYVWTNGDYDNYAEIMHSTNALRRNNEENETKMKANIIWKWKHILKPIWDENDL